MQWTPSPRYSVLHGVSCTSASACTAVGTYGPLEEEQTLAERWNGTRWAIQRTPHVDNNSYLNAVSCTSASACIAVGSSGASGAYRALAERWNGRRWAILRTPIPVGGSLGVLDGVSCISANACTAVGSFYRETVGGVTLAERWNGRRWKIQPTPNPTRPSNSGHELVAVSCVSASTCIAVGDSSSHYGTDVTLAERWNGTEWTIQRTPNSPVNSSYLRAVSCASASSCTAVGTSSITLAERWNGSRWTTQRTPSPTDSTQLDGTACPSTGTCTAVGYYVINAGAYRTLAERWNG